MAVGVLGQTPKAPLSGSGPHVTPSESAMGTGPHLGRPRLQAQGKKCRAKDLGLWAVDAGTGLDFRPSDAQWGLL